MGLSSFYFLFSRIALINLSFLLSALSLFKERTAQIAAGSHPIRVICKIRQMIPVKTFPRTIKDKKGNNMASNMIVSFNLNDFLKGLRIKMCFKSKRIFSFVLSFFKIFKILFLMFSHINKHNGKIDKQIFVFRT